MFILFPLKQRKFTAQKPRNTVQKSGRFKKQAKDLYQQLPQQQHLGSERVFPIQSNDVGFYYRPSTKCHVINICRWKNYLCRCGIQTFVKQYIEPPWRNKNKYVVSIMHEQPKTVESYLYIRIKITRRKELFFPHCF